MSKTSSQEEASYREWYPLVSKCSTEFVHKHVCWIFFYVKNMVNSISFSQIVDVILIKICRVPENCGDKTSGLFCCS
jgi:hypothetical protein